MRVNKNEAKYPRFDHPPTRPEVAKKMCSGSSQYIFRSQVQILSSHDCTGYYLGGEFSAGTTTSERVDAPTSFRRNGHL